MTESATSPDDFAATAQDGAQKKGARQAPVLAADGRPLKASLNRALRAQKMRALMLIAPLLIFILVTFVAPIADMLFRSVENQIVSETFPRTVMSLEEWDTDGLPGEDTYAALTYDFVEAAERRLHTRVGSRLNYETTGMSSIFRKSGRDVGDVGEAYADQFIALDPAWEDPATWVTLLGSQDWLRDQAEWTADATEARSADMVFDISEPRFALATAPRVLLPETADAYRSFAQTIADVDQDSPTSEEPWNSVYLALYRDLMRTDAATIAAYDGPGRDLLVAADAAVDGFEAVDLQALYAEMDDGWVEMPIWETFEAFSDPYTAGYFLAAVDLQLTPDGIEAQPENQRVYILLFQRTIFMSLMIMGMCVLLGYPIAFLLSNLSMRASNLLLILVLLPFWTSLLVRTSAWKVLLQQEGVINDILVWIGLVADNDRLALINNQFGTIIAMTHILLPFMILPLYSVMKTIPPTYVRAAKSLGATNWTAFWRVYFPQSIPGIGAGCILVFILSIGYYITPELVGGRTGTFISNRIAFHISTSLNWGLAAALGSILLALVLALYWVYDRIVGIDNVKLG